MCGMCSPVQWNHETPNQSLNCGTLGKRGRLWVIIVSCLLPLLKTLQKRGTAKVLTNFQLPVWQKVCFVVFAASCRSRGKSYSQEFHFSHAFSFFWQNKKEEKSTQLRPTPDSPRSLHASKISYQFGSQTGNLIGQLELSEETLKDKDEILGGSRSFLQQFRTRMDGSS